MFSKKYMKYFFLLLVTSNGVHSHSGYLGFRSALIDREALLLGTASLETDRLILRQLTLADAQDMFVFTSDPAVETWDPVDKTIEDTRTYIKALQEKYSIKEPTIWGIEHKFEKKIIGYCGFTYFIDGHSFGEIEYALAKSYWHQGLMSEALSAMLDFVFTKLKINRVFAYTHLNNYRSMVLLTKQNFFYEGIHKERGYTRGAFWDLRCFVLLRNTYLSQKNIK